MQNQKYYTNNLILNVQVNVILLKLSTVGGRTVLPNKELQAYVITLYLLQVLLQHSRVHIYIYIRLLDQRQENT